MAASDDATERRNGVCTVDELNEIITAPSGGFILLPDTVYDEVYTGIFVGEERIAKDLIQLRRLGVTHIINAAQGNTKFHSQTEPESYKKINAKFLGISVIDHMNSNIAPYFESAAEFISEGVQSGGKVLVHCIEGISRSATLVVAYLMIKEQLDVRDALRMIRAQRNVAPNEGFLQELCDFNLKLFKQRQT